MAWAGVNLIVELSEDLVLLEEARGMLDEVIEDLPWRDDLRQLAELLDRLPVRVRDGDSDDGEVVWPRSEDAGGEEASA